MKMFPFFWAENISNNVSLILKLNNPHLILVITPGIKSLVHDVQLKRQKEIREIMKKKREKAMLVDRISRWLFPTSFILLNIVYWALFGDHGLWDNK